MVMHRLQADILCQDQDVANKLYDQLATLAPQYAAVGKDGSLFEPSTMAVQASTEDEDHISTLAITDPAIVQELYAFLVSKHPEYDQSQVSKGYAPSFIQLHDCYHDENPPQPCVISKRMEITPAMAVELGLPVAGAVIGDASTLTVIDSTFMEQVQVAKAARLEAEAVALKDAAPVVQPIEGTVVKE